MYTTVVKKKNKRVESIKIIHINDLEKYKKLGYKHITDPDKKAKYIRSDRLYLNDKYIIFEDGTIWSDYYHKWKKIQGTLGKTKYYGYSIKDQNSTKKGTLKYIARMLYYHFVWKGSGYIWEMPLITYKDGNPENYLIPNLVETNKKEVIEKVIEKKSKDATSKIKDTEENIITIALMMATKTSRRIAAKLFNTSEMSIHRFIKRNEDKLHSIIKNIKI